MPLAESSLALISDFQSLLLGKGSSVTQQIEAVKALDQLTTVGFPLRPTEAPASACLVLNLLPLEKGKDTEVTRTLRYQCTKHAGNFWEHTIEKLSEESFNMLVRALSGAANVRAMREGGEWALSPGEKEDLEGTGRRLAETVKIRFERENSVELIAERYNDLHFEREHTVELIAKRCNDLYKEIVENRERLCVVLETSEDECTPCPWLYSKEGCQAGEDKCTYCHRCPRNLTTEIEGSYFKQSHVKTLDADKWTAIPRRRPRVSSASFRFLARSADIWV